MLRNTDHIQPGREFYNLHPLDQTHLLVAAYDGGDRVDVTDTNGKRPRNILASSLRPDTTKPNGEPYKTGYAPA
ncbi:hypothetical protein [Nocardiopsis metallicus]|uniref:Uncharacterized protein n=1 Tax=Nocardiopsis metallicus TaxID=179819 RepID=A0A840WIK1_9ACTN|nr:hypothetical protein [Nocardiopsis metallicus]MBB5491336.1 hypothetical protein [Nocardiopsis metallicus]